MTSNVLPLFWHLASSSKDTRLNASAELVGSLEAFQQSHADGGGAEGSSADEDDDEDGAMDEDDEESGEEVDDDEDDDDEGNDGARSGGADRDALALDRSLAKANAEDVVYSVKRLIRGLGSSRESSRLGFAVALTEVR